MHAIFGWIIKAYHTKKICVMVWNCDDLIISPKKAFIKSQSKYFFIAKNIFLTNDKTCVEKLCP